MSQRFKIALAFTIVYLVWGSTYLALRVGVQFMPSAVLAGIRFASAGLILLVALAAARRRIWPTWRDLGILAAGGLFLLVLGNGLVALAEKTVPSGPAALVVATVPLWVAALQALLPGTDRLPASGWAGIALGLLGVSVLSWPHLTPGAGQTVAVRGIGILVAASFFWSVGTLLMRRRPVALDPLVATGWEMLLGGGLNLAAGLVFQRNEPIVWSGELVGALAYLVVFGSILAFSAYIWLVQNVPPAKAATYAYVNPVIAVFLGAWLLHERIDAFMLTGMAIILVAVMLVTSARTVPVPRAARPAVLSRMAEAGD